MQNKYDVLAFDAAQSARRVDANGFLHVSACPISKATVNPYLGKEIPGFEEMGLDPERIYYGLRDPQELGNAATSFGGLPLLLGHHYEAADAPQREHRVGSIGTDVFFDPPYLRATISVTDKEAIDGIEKDVCKQISCSYRYTPDMTQGEYEGIKYDFIMRDILGNHVAIVPQGRAGKDVVVSDGLPVEIEAQTEPKGEKRKMAQPKIKIAPKVLAFKNRRRQMLANDADLGIEATEVVLANMQEAVNIIEAQVEGYAPRDIGIDVDESITIDEIVDKYFGGVELSQKDVIKGILTKLKGDETVEDAPLNFAEGVAKGEKLEKDPAEREKLDKEHEAAGMEKELGKDDEDELTEKMKDPNFKAGFEAGTLYGEKREKANPEKIDRDHEREGEEKYLAKDELPQLLAGAKAEAEKNVMAKVRDLNTAAKACAFALGNTIDPLAYDSAEDIYAKALQLRGVDTKKYPKEAYQAMVDVMRGNSSITVANDAALKKYGNDKAGEMPDYLKGLKGIR